MKCKLYIIFIIIIFILYYNTCIRCGCNAASRRNVEQFSIGSQSDDNAGAEGTDAEDDYACYYKVKENCINDDNNCNWNSQMNICFPKGKCESHTRKEDCNTAHGGDKCKWLECDSFPQKHGQCPEKCEPHQGKCKVKEGMNDYNMCKPIDKLNPDDPCSIKITDPIPMSGRPSDGEIEFRYASKTNKF